MNGKVGEKENHINIIMPSWSQPNNNTIIKGGPIKAQLQYLCE